MKWAVVILLGVLLLVAPACRAADSPANPAGPQSAKVPEAAQASWEKLRADPTIQKDFLQPPAPPKPAKMPKWLRAILDALAVLLRFAFWIGLAAILGGFLYFFGRELIRLRRQPARTNEDKESHQVRMLQPEAEKAHVLLADADRLAGEGRFAEAVHLLLFRSIADIEERLPGAVKRSQTSREIEILAEMPPEPKSGFEDIRRRVETSFFGGRGMDADGYSLARQSYEAFAFSAQWGAK